MNNWMSRIAIFAILGAILSSAVLVGCGGNSEEGTTNSATTTTTTKTNTAADSGG